MAKSKGNGEKLYFGVDVGGTKIQAVLASPNGRVVSRTRRPTPRGKGAAATVDAIGECMAECLDDSGAKGSAIRAAGVAVPGVPDPEADRIVFAPNIDLAGVPVAGPLSRRFGLPVVLGNDVNLGTLGELWQGSARGASSVVGLFPGTGVGGGIILDGHVLTGRHGAAAEIGHMLMDPSGPVCGCGRRGCLEAIASRTAIERDIRAAVKAGRKTALTEIAGNLRVIKSGMLRRALEAGDELASEVLASAAEVLGHACMDMRRLVDPEMIVLGGGLMEACETFMMPIIERVLAGDPLNAAGPGPVVVVAGAGDDAVALGAVALARQAAGEDPFADTTPAADYPAVEIPERGGVRVGGKDFGESVIVRADGKVRKRAKVLAKSDADPAGPIDRPELEWTCKGAPRILVVAADQAVELTDAAGDFLRRRNIETEIIQPLGKGAEAFNEARTAKAAVFRIDDCQLSIVD